MSAARSAQASFNKEDKQTLPQYTQLPETGQQNIYATGDDGTLQAGVEWPNPRFADNGDGTVTDTLTGLMWLKDAGCLRKTWDGALQTVADLNSNPGKFNCLDYSARYSDWHVPSIRELESIVNFGESKTASWLNSNGFRNTKSSNYWSSTISQQTSLHQYAWALNMNSGADTTILRSTSLYVLPVRTSSVPKVYDVPKTGQTFNNSPGDDGDIQAGLEWPNPRFADNGDGTVTDTLTGLMWLKDAGCLKKTWVSALQTVTDLNANPDQYTCEQYSARYSDWRMPNARELESLVNFGASNTASWLSSSGFLNALPSSYWSSTTLRSNSSNAWVVNMQQGKLGYSPKSYSNYLIPVRGGL
jgi:hypothetical protein